jgi:hypothetical protein
LPFTKYIPLPLNGYFASDKVILYICRLKNKSLKIKKLLDQFDLNEISPKNIIWVSLFFLPIWINNSYLSKPLEILSGIFIQPWATLFGILFLSIIFFRSSFEIKCQIIKWSAPFVFLALRGFEIRGPWQISWSLIFILASYFIFSVGICFDKLVEKACGKSIANKTNEGLLSDDPIDSIENETFDRKEYAESIVNELKKTQSDRSFNIAVSGKWGSGKTSFMNLIKEYMDKDHFITMDYNPWDFKEEKFIDIDLLKAISRNLSNEKELEDGFQKLFNSLQGVNKSPWYKLFSFLIPDKPKSIQDYRDEIGKILIRKEKSLSFS